MEIAAAYYYTFSPLHQQHPAGNDAKLSRLGKKAKAFMDFLAKMKAIRSQWAYLLDLEIICLDLSSL